MDSGIKTRARVLGPLKNYHIWLSRRGIDKTTQERYCLHIELFRSFISLHPERYAKLDTSPDTAARAIREFIDYCYLTNRLNMRTTDHMLIALKSFFAYLGMERHIALRLADPAGKTHLNGGRYHLLTGRLTAFEQKSLRKQLSNRYQLMIFFLKSCRARISQICWFLTDPSYQGKY